MKERINQNLLFVINPSSGAGVINWEEQILTYFAKLSHGVTFFNLTLNVYHSNLEDIIKLQEPDVVIAVGGDGTIRFVAACLLHKNISLGIIPAGSANGLAMELGMSKDLTQALNIIVAGHLKTIHVIEINHQICIHLSDIGLNAHAIKIFEMQQQRGRWGYLLATLKVLWKIPKIKASLEFNNQLINLKAELIVIANSTTYGTGAVINPIGVLNDSKFEIIVVKTISVLEIFKMLFSHASFDSKKTMVYQTSALSIKTSKKAYFQMDGEYLGKINEITATIIPDAISIIVPV